MTPVAAIVLTIEALFAFHKPPTGMGAWFYVVIAMCVVGAIANFSLLYSTSPAYQNPTNQAFSLDEHDLLQCCWQAHCSWQQLQDRPRKPPDRLNV